MGNKKILVTGGAGYIGSHIAKDLVGQNYQVIVVDDLSNGFVEPLEIIKKQVGPVEFIKMDLKDKNELDRIFTENQIEAVMHLAAKVSVTESIKKPDLYYQVNYLNSVNLVDSMTEHNVNKIIFSSSCVVYGDPLYTPIDENHPLNPQCPYAQTKLDFEKYLSKIKNLQSVVFRYFNVGGSDPEGLLGKSNIGGGDIIDNIMKVALGQQELLSIFGSDYSTKDGTPVRDFVHVSDVSQAHLLALRKLDEIGQGLFNLGSEEGYTIKEIVEESRLVTGTDLPVREAPRRPADIPVSVASALRAKKTLGWSPKYSNLKDIISTDWNWRRKHPFGYSA